MRRTMAARTSCSIFVTALASVTTSSLDRMLAAPIHRFASDGIGACGLRITDCHPNKRLGFREFYIWVKDSPTVVRVGCCETQRNLSHSQSRRAATPRCPAVKIGPATADGTLYRPNKPSAPNIGGRRATVAPKFGPM